LSPFEKRFNIPGLDGAEEILVYSGKLNAVPELYFKTH